jgi:hypothetical protein
MTTPNSMPISDAPQSASRLIESPEMIDRLATELRARSGGELPHAFYVEQVKRQLGGKTVETKAANDEPAQEKLEQQPSVFHAWALSE